MIRLAVAVGIVAIVLSILREYRHHFYPKRFRIVELGAIYRGGRQTPPMLRKIIEKHQIRTIINLDDKVLEKDEPYRAEADRYAEEKAIAKEYGLQYHGFVWGGDGIAPFEEYNQVADILASTASRPVFVHCAAGAKRTNAALAAYWLRHRGYTFEQAVEHLQRDYGLIPKRKPDFLRHLRAYYEYASQKPPPNPRGTRSDKTQSHGGSPTSRTVPLSGPIRDGNRQTHHLLALPATSGRACVSGAIYGCSKLDMPRGLPREVAVARTRGLPHAEQEEPCVAW
ncbi:hypothetical protein AMJ85_11450 [candidate division BRC1 bacterium SM23_51]|nr:MAG: hypothetical protein AMJ85_11450 [candidate division BRC1 bacterium SM23_51]